MKKDERAKNKRVRREFNADFKREAVRSLEERVARGETLADVARGLGVRGEQLRRWSKAMAPEVSKSDGSGRRGRASAAEEELRRLRRENEVLRQERDFLKKATAYFAKGSH